MKTNFFYSLLFLVIIGVSCSKSNNSPDPDGGGGGGGKSPIASNGDIRGVINSDIHLTKDKVYRLRGYVYVATGATITIDPGTKIISNKDSAGVLVIYRGAKIMARGTASEPIVFTSGEASPEPGDLGGIVLAGQAPGNSNHKVIEGGVDAAFSAFGGTDPHDNSGVLKYVRIEYAGKAVAVGDEVNGLSLYGVGDGTEIDYVQVVRGLDDAYEFFGGTVNCKHLIAYNCADDDFDMDDGYTGKIQFAISVKDPKFTDAKPDGDVSNNFEIDNVNPSNGFLLTRSPITFPVMSNFTAIGPNDNQNTNFGWGMRWRRGCKFILANSVVIGGQDGGLRLQEDSTIQYYVRGVSSFYNSYVGALKNVVDVEANKTLTPPFTYDLNSITALITGRDKSTLVTDNAVLKLADPFNNTKPGLQPQSGSPLLTGALFDFSALTDSFFEKVAYKGALDGTNDWTSGWTVWGK
ncbi:MAG: hypothetical protein QM727_04285 [Niabella sp.]